MSDAITIEVSDAVRRTIEEAAAAHGVSPEEFVAAAAAEKAGALQSAGAYFAARAAQAKPNAFERVFGSARAGGTEPARPGDEISPKR